MKRSKPKNFKQKKMNSLYIKLVSRTHRIKE